MTVDEVRKRLDEIEQLAGDLLETPEDERIGIYRAMDPLFLQLEGWWRESPDPSLLEQIEELKLHTLVTARLHEPDGESDENRHLSALEILESLRSAVGR